MLSNINRRRFFHISLIVFIISLQCLVLLFWYLESRKDEKIAKIANDITHLDKAQSYSDQSRALLIKSQILYREYLFDKSGKALNDYFETVKGINGSLVHLDSELNSNFKMQDSLKTVRLKSRLDTIIKQTSYLDKNRIDERVINKFDYKEILNSVTFDSIVTRDSIAKKGFFSRMLDAISGKYSIQKEKIEIIASYKYQNKVSSGELKSQIEKILKDSDTYYKSQINAVKESFGASNGYNSKLHVVNDSLLNSTSDLIDNYNNIIQPLKNSSNDEFKATTQSNSTHRNYLIFALTLLMLVFSVILFRYTLYTYELEKKLVTSQEQILKSLDYKNKIMGMVSHEVRSPLSIISLYCKMIVSKVKDAEIKEVFNSIQNTTSTLLLLTNQILEYSKNEDRKMKLNKSKFNLKQELTNIVEPLKKLCIENENQFQWNNLVEVIDVNSDVIKINQLFYNLVGNALKFTKNGTITIDTKTEKVDSKTQFYVTVSDTGSGISEEDLKHVFEDYFQGSNGLTTMGVGLGLKLCKEIVELFEGEISIQSEKGKGTTVSFMLKL
ncbi:HAMP domain-containing sensor histidine kinase [Flavobacterium sp.]|uniref:sensor histidine kinase n=1 Tax=Flavobacterium sp. TaxID=239 RepID=UPI002B4AEE0B|nr:HAMP domain-containing sensor histidine kinase [Flavobacterium sp.]HLP64547.1 HAMP domain-containing sensor histidine kinase [Flavobacterium sp.]